MGMHKTASFQRLLMVATLIVLGACGGGGGGNGGGGGSTTTTVSGRITFDRVPVGNSGLNFNGTTQAPARDIVVEAIQASDSSVLAATTTNSSGDYSLNVPASRTMFIRAKAQMLQTGSGASWNFRVLNNTNSNALYVLDGSQFNSGTAASTRNLHAPSGWGGSSYTGTRAAAPFAMLDTIYQAKALLLTADANLVFPALDVYWSSSNRASDSFCPSQGDIGTSSFIVAASGETDDCSPGRTLLTGIYVLGFFSDPTNSDTDEFDQHVVAHELGHAVEAGFSRSDSIGGDHGFGEALDLRVAFGEGWGNGFAAMVLNNPVYRDSFGTTEVGGFNLDANADDINGWYSEAAVGHILWDLFDAGVEPGIDNIQVPFSTLFSVFANGEKTTSALTSIFSYIFALETADPASSGQALDALLTSEGVNGTDEFGANEFNFGTNPAPPSVVYVSIAANNTPTPVCTNAAEGIYNKLHNRRFLRLDLPTAGNHSIVVTGAAVLNGSQSPNPQLILWRQGEVLAVGTGSGFTETLSSRQFSAGTYIIEVFDSNYGSIDGQRSSQQRCMNVTVN